jgi:hypothetical protein
MNPLSTKCKNQKVLRNGTNNIIKQANIEIYVNNNIIEIKYNSQLDDNNVIAIINKLKNISKIITKNFDTMALKCDEKENEYFPHDFILYTMNNVFQLSNSYYVRAGMVLCAINEEIIKKQIKKTVITDNNKPDDITLVTLSGTYTLMTPLAIDIIIKHRANQLLSSKIPLSILFDMIITDNIKNWGIPELFNTEDIKEFWKTIENFSIHGTKQITNSENKRIIFNAFHNTLFQKI